MTQVINAKGFVTDAWAGKPCPERAAYDGGAAVVLGPGDDVRDILAHLPVLELIVIAFPGFADGRGFSVAQRLREAGYRGHLRARGHVLVDQLRAVLRCGFDTVEVAADQLARNPEHQWRGVRLGDSYQQRLFTCPAD